MRVKRAGDVTPATAAVTWKAPVALLAVIAGDVAMPLASVVTVAGPENVTLAPLVGAVKVTCAPPIGL